MHIIVMMLKHRFWILCLLLSPWISYAQNDVPPPLNPFDSPWPSPPAEGTPNGVPAAPPPSPGLAPSEPPPAAMAPSEESGGFGDPFEDDDMDSGGGGSRPSKKSEGKKSFMLLSPEEHQACPRWVNELDGATKFEDQDACLTSLDQKAKKSLSNITSSEEGFKQVVIESAAKGKITRAESKTFQVSHEKLRSAIQKAIKKRCTCAK